MIDPPQIISTMTPFPYSIDIDEPIDAAVQLMREHGVHHLPVTAAHELVGLVTKHDIRLRRSPDGNSADQNINTVRDVYIAEPYIVDVGFPLDEVLMTMSERHISSTIVTKHGKLVGILTTHDVCRTFANYMRDRFGEGDGDNAA